MAHSPQGQLLRTLGAGFGVAVAVGMTIAVGILRTPGEVASYLGSPSLILLIWLGGALYAALGAFSLAELGAAIPNAGGFYSYVHRAFGERAGFLMGWCDWLANAASLAFMCATIGEYQAELWPVASAKTFITANVLFFAALHWRGIRLSAAFQNWTSALKTAAFLALTAACFWLAPTLPAAAPYQPSLPLLTGLVLSAQAVIYSYDGWYNVIYFAEEQHNPGRTILRSMLGGIAAIGAVYVLLNAAMLAVLPMNELAASKLPAADAARRIFGAQGGTLITVLAVLSLIPAINAQLLATTRIGYSMARDILRLPLLGDVSASGTPRPSMLLVVLAAWIMALSGSSGRLLAIAGFYAVAGYTASYLSLFRLRQTEPALPRPVRARAYPFSTGLVLGVSAAFLLAAIAADTRNSVYALLGLLAAAPLYRLRRKQETGVRSQKAE